MNVNNFSSFQKASYFCGFEPNYDRFVPRGLEGEAKEESLKNIQATFNTYKTNITFTYEEYLNLVEDCKKDFTAPEAPADRKAKIISKLEEMAEEHINNVESKRSCLYTLVQRIVNFFKGRGFCTQGERGLNIVNQIKEAQKNSLAKDLATAFMGDLSDNDINMNECANKANALSDPEFKSLLKNTVFKVESSGSWTGGKKKLAFYEGLTSEKQIVFMEELVKRDDWFKQAYEITEYSEQKIKNFVQPLIQKFIVERNKCNVFIQNSDEKGLYAKIKFMNIIAAEAIRCLTANKDYITILDFCQRLNLSIKRDEFTEDELRPLIENIRSTYLMDLFEKDNRI